MRASLEHHLARGARVVAACGDHVVGLAVYEQVGDDLRVLEFGVDPRGCRCSPHDIATALLDTLEMGCLAAGGQRVVVTPRAAPVAATLKRRGYQMIAEGCAGTWFEKGLSGWIPLALRDR